MGDVAATPQILQIEIPFPSARHAEIALLVLEIDSEPSRSGVTKTLEVKDNYLTAKFTAEFARQLRVSANAFFENVRLIVDTFEFTGDTPSPNYTHF